MFILVKIHTTRQEVSHEVGTDWRIFMTLEPACLTQQASKGYQ